MNIKKFLAAVSAAVMVATCTPSSFSVFSAEEPIEFGLGALEVSPSEEEAFYSQFDNSDNGITQRSITNLPDSCDLSDDIYFPSIGDQGEINSCVAWATTYYQFTYAANKLNDIPTVGYSTYSPTWTYNYTNGGGNNTSKFTDAYNVLINQGAVHWNDMPYSSTNYDYTSWCTNTSTMMNALKTRVSYCGETSIISDEEDPVITSNKDTDLNEVKSLLNTGHILMITVNAANELSNWSFKSRRGNSSEYVAYRASSGTTGHAMVVVGYDDNVECDVNGDGIIQPSEQGAFKIANSVGTSWKNQGFCWVLYDALNYVSANKTNDWESDESGRRISIFERQHPFRPNNIFRYIEVENYDVNLAGLLTINTSNRNNINVNLFRNSNSSTDYTDSILYLDGNRSNTTAQPFNGSIVFDYGEFDDPASICTNGRYFGVDIKNVSSKLNTYFTNVSYKIIDNEFNVVKSVPVSSLIFSGNNSKRSVKIQCPIGDVDYDGSVTANDSALLMNYVSNTVDISNLQLYLGDFHIDGVVDIADVNAINRSIISSRNVTTADIMKISEINKQAKNYMLENNYSSSEIQKTYEISAQVQNLMGGVIYG